MTTARDLFAWRIGGEQGDGIDSTGDLLATVANRAGYFVYGYRSFSSRIKGGHTAYTLRLGTRPAAAAAAAVDLLVALNPETLTRHAGALSAGGRVVTEPPATLPAGLRPEQVVAVPLTALARAAGSPLTRNVVALGASAALLGLDPRPFLAELARKFGRKGEALLTANRTAFLAGYRAVPAGPGLLPAPPGPNGRLLLTGNQAIALGALAAGCRLLFAYPITPATDIMETLAGWFPEMGGAVVQMEDELASITAAIGAGFAGVRAMTATSGPGLSLMQEALGLASMAEIPVVVVDTQRSGPSTGMPTREEQSDLDALIYGGHGEGPRIVLSPGTVEEAFQDAVEAFNLAEEFQTPVLIASDLALALWKVSVPRSALSGPVPIRRGRLVQPPPDPFLRYRFTADGISPRTLPGEAGGQYLATGAEHGPAGRVDEDPGNRTRMMGKRLRKLEAVHRLRRPLAGEGPAAAPLVLLGMGSVTGALREARRLLEAAGQGPVRVIWPRTLAPLDTAAVREALAPAREVVVVEENATGQLLGLLARHGLTDGRFRSLRRYDGQPFTAAAVAEAVAQGQVLEVTR
ncbi:MAG: 2-oxoacid:acceptor oxidoreductase subunit alpha [Firmicutes bacterium]|nr:2-oxoacid:acceptor oxidoreductase subunit alpha [Bacillota bacterium]